MSAFIGGLPAKKVHTQLQSSLAELRCAEKNAVLWFAEIHSRKLYRELGYASIHHYAAEALGFKQGKIYQVLRMASALEQLPATKEAAKNGDLEWTKLRNVTSIATPETERDWLEVARRSTSRKLEQKVRIKRAEAKAARQDSRSGQLSIADTKPQKKAATEVPVTVSYRFSTLQFARLEAMMEKLRKRGQRESKEELLIASFELLVSSDVETGSTRVQSSQPTYQVHVHQCEECKSATVPNAIGDKPLSTEELEAILCDARVSRKGRRNEASIPPKLRQAVMARDRHRCRTPGCRHTRFLAVHHLEPREANGPNLLENLITLCGECHRALHKRATPAQLTSRGTIPQISSAFFTRLDR